MNRITTMTNRKLEALPLLTTFQALMEHGGVSAAATALGVSQSAVSKQLAKLRAAYGDDLFIRTADGMRPTPRAATMSERVSIILAEAEALSETRLFDPAALEGEITLSTTDEIRCALVTGLVERLDQEAPKVRLTFLPLRPDYSRRELEAGHVDLVISVNWHAPDELKQIRLQSDRFVCLMGAAHPLAMGAFTIEAYAATTHVMVAPLGRRLGYIDDLLARHGLRRFIRLSLPEFYQIKPGLLGNRHISTLPNRVAQFIGSEYAAPGELVVRPLPLDVPPLEYFALWHPRFDRDPRHVWIRGLVRDILRDT